MKPIWYSAVTMLFCVAAARADDVPGTAKIEKVAPPKELKESVQTLLSDDAVQLADGSGTVWATLWFRKAIPAKAAPEQIKNGLTYREVPTTTLVGAVRFTNAWSDFRKQQIPAGVYTLRMALQPMDGDHQGTAPYSEFLLLVPAAKDAKPDPMETKALNELSAEAAGGSHPAVMLLFPGDKAGAEPKLAAKPGKLVLLNLQRAIDVGGKAATLGFAVVVQGHSMQE